MHHQVIVFDFDGTLVNSNTIKREAFAHVFSDRPECARIIPRVLGRMKASSRNEVIESIAANMQGLSVEQKLVEASMRTHAYSAWVEEKILELATESPAEWLLPQWHQNFILYICSLTPTDPLRKILHKLGWLKYFRAVEGFPVTKEEMLQRTIAKHGLINTDVLMVGDGENDEAAALAVGSAFFRIRDTRNLLELAQYLES